MALTVPKAKRDGHLHLRGTLRLFERYALQKGFGSKIHRSDYD